MELPSSIAAQGYAVGIREQQASLESGDTSIMIRSIPRTMSTDDLIVQLNEVVNPWDYNMVHMPHSKTGKNTGFAVINCTSPMAAQKCFRIFSQWHLLHQGRTVMCRASQAHIQGLGSNLAFFLMTRGLDELNTLSAPRVFHCSEEVPLPKAIALEVTESMLYSAYSLKVEVDMQKTQKASRSANRNTNTRITTTQMDASAGRNHAGRNNTTQQQQYQQHTYNNNNANRNTTNTRTTTTQMDASVGWNHAGRNNSSSSNSSNSSNYFYTTNNTITDNNDNYYVYNL
eukprot:TRINITY_DN5353_c0_g2_i1.p1 TRINITY_DN5353_c0_g2~~TRINITY_DN5353_c0_g2_i1.p1  ORF type:complete len:286 (-),score=62.06 TRINITY_DN5353_c0_g2_i1:341-1198(-)